MILSRFVVEKMDCPSEEQLVRMALSDLDGVDAIRFDLPNRSVDVSHSTVTSTVAERLHALDLGTRHVEDRHEQSAEVDTGNERPALVFALTVNALFFVGELTVGLLSRSMGLVGDALDMGADASVYALSLAAIGTAMASKKRLARWSALIQGGLATFGLLEVLRRIVFDHTPPQPVPMAITGLLALAANVVVLIALQRVRSHEPHLQASWICTNNDLQVNSLVIAAAVGVALTGSAIPDLLVGGLAFLIVANGSRQILRLSR